jgi:hypothetical protein
MHLIDAVSNCRRFVADGRATRLALCLMLALTMTGGLTAVAPVSAAQEQVEWQAAKGEDFTVLMQPNERLSADSFLDAYGAFAALAIKELSLLLGVSGPAKTIVLYVFADDSLYATAVAQTGRNEVDDVIAVADPVRYSVMIRLTRFVALIPPDAENQLRHAVAHVMAGQATNFLIPRGFDEGFARYVERPNQPALARLASIVQGAQQEGKLASWSNMNRLIPLDDEALIEAQAYAVVGYLLKHYGLPAFRTFLDELQTAATWRDAIKVAYAPGTSDSIERQWRDEIPLWAQGDWKWNLVAGFDLEPARDLLARGNFDGAASVLLVSEQLLSDIDDPDRQAEVTELKDQARIGSLAEAKMIEAQQALENFAYDRAAAAVNQADEQYRNLPPELRPAELIEEYRFLAQSGLEATEQLEIARIQSGAWGDYPEARTAALSAGSSFALLGDSANHEDATSLIDQMDNAQLRLVLLLGALVFLTAAWMALWLRYRPATRLRWDR